MMCQWDALLNILPPHLRQAVDSAGKITAQEIRLRIKAPPEIITKEEMKWLPGVVTGDELRFVVNAASRYSPWAAATAAQGYLTAPGGHRIGLCGEAVVKDGRMTGIREIRSLCIRVARDFPGIGRNAAHVDGSVLILGAPGWGKTTLLRDLVRQLSEKAHIAVVDERGELFPEGLPRGRLTDVLTGCPKAQGIEVLLRTMGPSCIAVDEITCEEDAQALTQAAFCGVRLIATAHGASLPDLRRRPVYRELIQRGVFDSAIVLRSDKSYSIERMAL